MREKKMRHKNSGVENAGKVTCVIKLNRHKVNDKRVESTVQTYKNTQHGNCESAHIE